MKSFTEENGQISINGNFTCSVEVFRILEPTYEKLPEGYSNRHYIPGKSHILTSSKGFQKINKEANWTDGDRYISRIEEFVLLKNYILRDEIETGNLIAAEIKNRIPYNEKRKCEFPGVEELVIALWENIVEKKTKKESGILDIQKRREAVKNKYPKG